MTHFPLQFDWQGINTPHILNGELIISSTAALPGTRATTGIHHSIPYQPKIGLVFTEAVFSFHFLFSRILLQIISSHYLQVKKK